ncbi:SDR family oxidoreductase [Hankyongella ginsenosidimutans]|uniref:SDR family oxidoreductase n=1 Tax=Hankyongella ginsenosidimutans TaxID=1763828 RepID=A0A4D7CB13_9SPHN|nr:SDR family oxidoreductase [Hankyongella ginsenosidimutans]QCI78776.1 SDR family oxidoreductase [Hankyongella ginsenosidimutans]
MSKIILITGAASGFGRDTAETLAAAGHKVYASMRDVAGRNAEAANALRAKGIGVVELDVADDTSVARGVAQVLSEAGRIDVLVNNAGFASAGVSEAFTADQAKVLFNTNVVGVIRTTKAVLPAMRAAKDGLIINIGSILGRVTFPFFGIYGATKFAVEALTDSYRYELSQLGVDVVLIQPSAYPTNMYSAIQQPADAQVGAAYGEIGAIPGKMFETFMGMFQSENAPNPHDIATAIVSLVDAAKGTRPARTVVGQPFGADAVNAATAPVQQGVIDALGLGFLATIAG